MDKYKFLKDTISDSVLEEVIIRTITDILLLQPYRFDNMQQLAYKIQRQWNYKFEFKYENFKKKDVVEKYNLSPDTDVYVKVNDDKNYTFIFNKSVNKNLQRYLFLKAWAFDIFDEIQPGDELRLSVMKCNSEFERNWAERLAIELTMSNDNYYQMNEGCKGGHIVANQRIMEPELYDIRKHEYYEEGVLERKWMIPERKILRKEE
jgi:hypothetical protein